MVHPLWLTSIACGKIIVPPFWTQAKIRIIQTNTWRIIFTRIPLARITGLWEGEERDEKATVTTNNTQKHTLKSSCLPAGNFLFLGCVTAWHTLRRTRNEYAFSYASNLLLTFWSQGLVSSWGQSLLDKSLLRERAQSSYSKESGITGAQGPSRTFMSCPLTLGRVPQCHFRESIIFFR